MASKAAPKYIGYVGGVAVAAGIGTALAVAGQGTAHADEKDAGAKSGAVDAGPKKAEAKTHGLSKPLSKVGSQAEKAVNDATKKVTAAVTKALKPTVKPQTATSKPTAKEFEATQVKLLKAAFTPKKAAVTPKVKSDSSAKSVSAAEAAGDAPFTNPFRADDPDPDDMPAPVLGLEGYVRRRLGPDAAAVCA